MLCPKCSASLEDNAKFCDTCGNTISATEKDPIIGRILLNQYVVQKKLGEGGYGSVYEAEQPAFRRKVAIKTLHKHLSTDPKVVKRFHREGMVASQLEQNPSAVKMLNVGETEDGYLWIAMEFIQGETLDDRIQKGPLSLSELLDIMGPVCNLLDEAHQKTIIHRDLKPDNIMLTQHQGKVIPKVLDFGIAGIVDHQEASRPTQTGMVTGTPPYMPPEQWKGLKHTDTRSDIYALGVIVYECLSGKLPFEANTVPDWMIRHVMQAPRELSIVMAKNPPPKNVEKAVMKALEKEPKDRYQSAGEFFRALAASSGVAGVEPPKQQALATVGQNANLERQSPATTPTLPQMTIPSPPTMPTTVARPVEKKNTGFLLGGAAVIALAAGSYFLLTGKDPEKKKVAPSIDIALPNNPLAPNDPTKTTAADANPNNNVPSTWTPIESGVTVDLYSVFGSAAAIYAVGDGGTVAYSTDTNTWRKDELDFSSGVRFGAGQVSEVISDVWVNAQGEAFFVHGDSFFNGSPGNWDGFEIGKRGSLQAIWSAPGAPIVVGGDNIYTSRDGVNWQRGRGLGLGAQVLSIWGGQGLFAGGQNGLLARSLDQGQSWESIATGTSVSFNDIAGNSTHIYAAGDAGVLLVSTNQGASWSQIKTNLSSSLQSLWVTPNGEIYVVGTGGLILFSADQGKTWTKQESQTKKILYGVWGSPSGALFAVGESGTILTLQ